MKKILHMTPPEVSNGVYRYIFNHMPFIDQKEYEFSFLTKAVEDLKRTEEYKKYRFPVFELKGAQRDGRDRFVTEIKNVLNCGFDAIHLHTSAWRGFLIEEIAMEYKGMKVIVHSHSSGIDFEDAEERNTILKDHEFFKERFSMKYATDVCACSNIAADWLFGNQIPRNIIKKMPNAIDVSKYRFNGVLRKQLRKKMNLEDRIVIGNIGRYSYTKNQEFLVKVFSEAYKNNQKLFLIMVGQGENISKIQKLVKQLNMEQAISCNGWSDNISEWLQIMDLFCLPSKFEGLPLSVVEAQASGLPCLVSDQVTMEVNITGHVKFLPLDEDIWVRELSVVSVNDNRSTDDEIFSKTDFNIETSSALLKQLYC